MPERHQEITELIISKYVKKYNGNGVSLKAKDVDVEPAIEAFKEWLEQKEGQMIDRDWNKQARAYTLVEEAIFSELLKELEK